MAKRALKPGTLLGPLPAVMVTCGDMDNANIITIAWTGIVNSDPPMTYVSVRPGRYSHDIIEKTGEFAINLVTSDLTYETDFCGVRSGRDMDKFKEMGLTKEKAEIISCPLIAESPVNLECRVTEKHIYGTHDMFIAEIINVKVDETLMEKDGRLALEKAGLISFLHGDYIPLKKSPIGNLGYSVMKKKTKKRRRREGKPVYDHR